MSKVKVLVCDDMPDFLSLISEMIRADGGDKYQIDLVSTAEAADILLRDLFYDIVIIDRAFPGMSGEYPAQIARRKGSLVIGVTGYLPDNDRFNESVDHLLMKPFHSFALLSLVRGSFEDPLTICGDCFVEPCKCEDN